MYNCMTLIYREFRGVAQHKTRVSWFFTLRAKQQKQCSVFWVRLQVIRSCTAADWKWNSQSRNRPSACGGFYSNTNRCNQRKHLSAVSFNMLVHWAQPPAGSAVGQHRSWRWRATEESGRLCKSADLCWITCYYFPEKMNDKLSIIFP